MAFVNVGASPKIDFLKPLKDTFEFQVDIISKGLLRDKLWFPAERLNIIQKHQKREHEFEPYIHSVNLHYTAVKMFTIFCALDTKLDPHFPSLDLTSSSQNIFLQELFFQSSMRSWPSLKNCLYTDALPKNFPFPTLF